MRYLKNAFTFRKAGRQNHEWPRFVSSNLNVSNELKKPLFFTCTDEMVVYLRFSAGQMAFLS